MHTNKKGRCYTMKKNLMKTIAILVVAACLTLTFGISAASADSAAPVYSADELFTSRDLKQEADLSDAVYYKLASGQDIHIGSEGVYVLSGTAANMTVYVEAGKEDKVQLVLSGVTVTNADFPVIYVTSADKVFVTTSVDSLLSVTGAFRSDGETNTDGVIFSKSDLVLNGTAALTISSSENGVVGKDDLKIADGTLALTVGTDGLHAENDDDDTKGYIYIGGGNITVQAGDDGIHGTSVVQIDGGILSIKAVEGIEGTYIRINGGTIDIQASDDGVNAARKSSAYTPTVEINGGEITVVMGAGDTDGIDSNGNIIINGGTINVTGNSTFDYDGSAQYNGGTIIVNGQQVNSIPNQMMGGRGGQNFGFGGQSGWGSQNGSNNQSGSNGRSGGRGGRGR